VAYHPAARAPRLRPVRTVGHGKVPLASRAVLWTDGDRRGRSAAARGGCGPIHGLRTGRARSWSMPRMRTPLRRRLHGADFLGPLLLALRPRAAGRMGSAIRWSVAEGRPRWGRSGAGRST